MENATKALLIAAAVLIVIVLIALGVALLNSGSDVTGQAKSVGESTAVQTFNGQFTAYLGERQNASTVRALLTIVKASNNNSASKVTVKDSAGTMMVNGENNTADSNALSIKDGKFYSISADDGYADDGRIETIVVTEK